MSEQPSALEQQELRRIQTLVETLESGPDSTAGPARELLQVVLDLHARGLNRMMGIVADSEKGGTLIEQFTADESVNALLLLHDLHPRDVASRVHEAAEQLRPHLAVEGVGISSIELADDGVRVKLHSTGGRTGGHGASDQAIRSEIEQVIFGAAPEIGGIEIEGLPVPTVAVPVSSVGKYRPGKTADG